MKFRKLKLAALLATAVLTAGTMSLTSLAADDEVEITIDNDGGENETLPEYGVMPIAVGGATSSENTGSASSGVGKGFVLDEASLQFYYQASGHKDGEVTYIMYLPKDASGKNTEYVEKYLNGSLEDKYVYAKDKAHASVAVVLTKDATKEAETIAECKNLKPEGNEPTNGDEYEAYCKLVYNTISFKVDIDGVTYHSEAIPYGDKVQHTWKYSTLGGGVDPTCTDEGGGHIQKECTVCHYVTKDTNGGIPALGHSWSDVVYYVGLGTIGATPEVTNLSIDDDSNWGNWTWDDSNKKSPKRIDSEDSDFDPSLTVTDTSNTRLRALIADEYTPKPNVTGDYRINPSKFANINVKIQVDANGKMTGVALDDETKDGCYWTAVKCNRPGCSALHQLEYHFIWAKTAASAKITAITNVPDKVYRDVIAYTEIPLDGSAVFDSLEANMFELADCRKDSVYTVTYYNSDGGAINHRYFTIPAHHLYEYVQHVSGKIVNDWDAFWQIIKTDSAKNYIPATYIEFANQADAKLCSVKWIPYKAATQTEAHWEVKNTGCDAEDPITYWEVKHCIAGNVTATSNGCGLTNCKDRIVKGSYNNVDGEADKAGAATATEHGAATPKMRADAGAAKEASATGYHQYHIPTYDAVHSINVDGNPVDEGGHLPTLPTGTTNKVITWDQFKTFKTWADSAATKTLLSKKELIFTYDDSDCYDCEKDGILVVEYPCKACGYTPVKRETYTIKATPKHILKGASWDESIQDPTCTKPGKHYTLRECDRCKEAVSDGRVVETPRLPHTNELSNMNRTPVTYEADVLNKNKEPVLLQTIGTIVVDNNSCLLDAFRGGSATNKTTTYTGYLEAFANQSNNNDNAILTVDAYLYTVCESCKEYKVGVTIPKVTLNKNELKAKKVPLPKTKTTYSLDILIKNIVPQDTNVPCKPGSITLTFSYSDENNKAHEVDATFPYYTSKATYAARGSHKYGAEYLDTAASVAPTETTEGKNVYKRKCEVCGEETVVRTVTVPALGTPAEKLGAVTGLKAEAIGLGRVQLSWNPVEGADYYTILLHDSFEYQGSIAAVKAPKCTITVSGLDTEVFSHIWVAPVKKGSNGKDTVGDAGEYVSILAREVPSVTGVKTTIEDGKILVTWKAQSRANTYSVVVKSTTDSASTKYVVGDETEFTLNNTVKGKGYYFWVYAGFENSRTNKDGKSIGQSVSTSGTFASAVAK